MWASGIKILYWQSLPKNRKGIMHFTLVDHQYANLDNHFKAFSLQHGGVPNYVNFEE